MKIFVIFYLFLFRWDFWNVKKYFLDNNIQKKKRFCWEFSRHGSVNLANIKSHMDQLPKNFHTFLKKRKKSSFLLGNNKKINIKNIKVIILKSKWKIKKLETQFSVKTKNSQVKQINLKRKTISCSKKESVLFLAKSLQRKKEKSSRIY